ncbi:N-acetyl-gamma-glutamyl-phosphate reductase [Candidatus Woesearchaeota archaeon]|nr:N-acetyl-gamma-glutamyl-phosphate reductase [Candidatus Woesearchaeota archaeon]
MHKVGIIGASGYTGYELIKILSKHKGVKLSAINSESCNGMKVNEVYDDYKGNEIFTNYTIDEINKMGLDVMFLALPHTESMNIVPKLKAKVIDLSADYRFEDKSKYEAAYGIKHTDLKRKSVYGLPELFADSIKKAKLIGNPGCYATGMILASLPIMKKAESIVFDCKSGWSGAGKSSKYAKDSSLLEENIIAYNLTKHRHRYEVEQFIKAKIAFTPHVISPFRGMMITAHIFMKEKIDVEKAYASFYSKSKFVEVRKGIPDLHDVKNTNKCIIGGFEIDENRIVVIAVLDNLLKGASGQAVQNMNLMLGFNEAEGLL